MSQMDRFFERCRQRIQEEDRGSGRTDLSRRREQVQINQRVMWGDLKPGQRSLNEPHHD